MQARETQRRVGGLGAIPREDGEVVFRVWAPERDSVEVRIGDRRKALTLEDDGVWAGHVQARPGNDYLYVLDRTEERPDPCSRFQPQGIRGASRVVDTTSF